jgi:peptide/nickel transport system substrate-binding protein
LIAGCGASGDGSDGSGDGSDGGGDGSDGGGDGSDGILDRTYGFNYANVPFTRTNLNPYNANSDWGLRLQLQGIFSKPSPTHAKIVPHAVKDWEFSNKELRIHFRQPWVWSNGKSAGAKDAVVQFQLARAMVPEENRPEDPTVTEYAADGQETFILKLSEPYNKQALVYNVITGYERLDTYRNSPLGDFNEQLKEASTPEEKKKIRKNVVQRTKGMAIGEYPISAPWIPTNITPSVLETELNTEHYAAKTQGGPLNFKNLHMLNFGDQSPTPAFESGKLQISGASLPTSESEYPENVYSIKAAEYGGQSIVLNYLKDDFYTKPQVRQGLAYVLDREQISSNVGSTTNAAGAQAASKPIPELMPSVAKDYIPDLWPKFKAFKHTSENLTKAENLFKDAGLQKDDGKWYKPNGDRFKIPLLTTQSTVTTIETVSKNLKEFGIQSSIEVVGDTTFSQRLEGGDWTVYVNTWGEFAFPPLNYRATWGPGTEDDPRGEGNPPHELDVPMPVGDWEGDMQTLNLREIVKSIESATNPEKNKEITRKLAWAAHYHQVYLVLYTNASTTPTLINDKWEYPKVTTDGWVKESDAEVWGCDSPETSLIQGVGGIKAQE